MRTAAVVAAALITLAAAVPTVSQDASDEELLTCGYLCSDDGTPLMTALDGPPDVALVTKIFIGAFSEPCGWALGGGPASIGPEVHDLTYRPSWADNGEPDRQLKLYRFFCGAGAYNQRHVYYTWTSDSGVRPVLFPVPAYTAEYEDGDFEAPLKTLTMTGMRARHELVNSAFDEASATISEWSCWRGLCDASGRGEWVLDNDTGEFRLVTYDIDPTYDGEVNLFRLVDYGMPVPIDTSAPLPFEPPVLDEEDGAES